MKRWPFIIMVLFIASLSYAGDIPYERIKLKDSSYKGCTHIQEDILVSADYKAKIPALKKLIVDILNQKKHYCGYSVYIYIPGKNDLPLIGGIYKKDDNSISYINNETMF
ncbi:hypothetical protein A2V82_16335 [candidate division KSB1 bacterium RBG_16_48_16]|nr:MAG: hypothetical protein A2V82_16335 [candidate division KSB1 bacterium RBG_16_48_16]